jgi:hypothetical protein
MKNKRAGTRRRSETQRSGEKREESDLLALVQNQVQNKPKRDMKTTVSDGSVG